MYTVLYGWVVAVADSFDILSLWDLTQEEERGSF